MVSRFDGLTNSTFERSSTPSSTSIPEGSSSRISSLFHSETPATPPVNLDGRKLKSGKQRQKEQLEKVREIIESSPPVKSSSPFGPSDEDEPLIRILTLTIDGKEKYQLQKKSPGIKGLNFSGGGSKGVAYAGVIKALDEAGKLEKVERVSGASAGAMTALLVSIGVSSAAFERLAKEIDFVTFLTFFERSKGSWCPSIRSKGDGMIMLFEEIERCQIKAFFENDFLLSEEEYLSEHVNEEDSDLNYFLIKNRLEQYINREEGIEFTFADAINLRSLLKKENRHLIKDLYIGVTDMTQGGFSEYSYENTPQFSRARAAQISGAHPVAFCATKNEEGHKLSDGGIVNNGPVELLEKYSNISLQERAQNLNFVFATHINRNKCESAHIIDKANARKLKFRDIQLRNRSDVLELLKKKKKFALSRLIAPALGNQNLAVNDRNLNEKMRERSYSVIRLDTLSHGITTLKGLLPLSRPPSEESKENCIENARETVVEYLEARGLYKEEDEWYYENYDSLDELFQQVRP